MGSLQKAHSEIRAVRAVGLSIFRFGGWGLENAKAPNPHFLEPAHRIHAIFMQKAYLCLRKCGEVDPYSNLYRIPGYTLLQ